MGVEILPGVTVHHIPTKKFKTTQIVVRFTTPLTADVLYQRSLLASILENSSRKYPTPQLINERLADMYGATYRVDVARRGNAHELSFILNVVNDKFLNGDQQLLLRAFEFLNEVIFNPLTEGHRFNELVVAREQRNLCRTIRTMEDDKQEYALMRLQDLYFDEEAQAVPYYGTEAGVMAVTPEALYRTYQDMLYSDQVTIVVMGDVEQEQILSYVDQMPFTSRTAPMMDYFYYQPTHQTIDEKLEIQNVTQSKLTMAYQTGVYIGEVPYYTLQVFNGLFGGFPHSKLFMNIRERHSMAYYASSYIDGYRGELVVQAGIDAENKERVLGQIDTQLHAMAIGKFSDEDFNRTKAMLINQYLTRQDHPSAWREQQYVQWIMPDKDLSQAHYIESIQGVTRDDVATLARRLYLQTIYCLEGNGRYE